MIKKLSPLLLTGIISLCTFSNAYPQRQYYVGVPNHVDYVTDSVRIVLDLLPWNMNGRLLEWEMLRYLEPLKKFLEEHPGHKCNFLLYSSESNEEKNLAYTTYQGKRLSEYFTYVDTLFGQKYLNDIISHRIPNPIFQTLNTDSSERIHKADLFYLKGCVIVELIQQKPISKGVQKSLFYSIPIDMREFDEAPVLTSSLGHPKIFVKEFFNGFVPFHDHCPGEKLSVEWQTDLYGRHSLSHSQHLVYA